jgi:hypothetical protein
MGLVLHKPYKGLHNLDPHGAITEALERHREQLMRVRVELAELKRTGSQHGLPELTSEALTLSIRIKRLEYLLEQG